MNRNLITRMGLASGVVAALVAAVFAVLVTAVRDQRTASDAARTSEHVIQTAGELRRAATLLELGARGGLEDAADVRAADARLPQLLADLERQVGEEISQEPALRLVKGDVERYRAKPSPAAAAALGVAIENMIAGEQENAEDRRGEADRKANLAIAVGIGGLVGSAALIALLTTYLSRYIVMPLRNTVRAAQRLTLGDLSARVTEDGDAEPVELARAFNQMAASLEESERVKDEFFALVSHELRTPLTSIIGYLELVLDDERLSEDARRFLEVVDRNAKRLLRLVGDMLFVAQVEAGRLSLERGDVELDDVAAQAIEAARPAAARAGVSLELDAGDVEPLFGDRDRLGQMVDNLISNAIKFTPEGGAVTVRVRDRGDDSATLEVADDGIGIPADEQQYLFERFFRASSATSAAVPGAGLGLTIVKTIVEAHGGRLELISGTDSGTTVRVDLPYDGGAATAPAAT